MSKFIGYLFFSSYPVYAFAYSAFFLKKPDFFLLFSLFNSQTTAWRCTQTRCYSLLKFYFNAVATSSVLMHHFPKKCTLLVLFGSPLRGFRLALGFNLYWLKSRQWKRLFECCPNLWFGEQHRCDSVPKLCFGLTRTALSTIGYLASFWTLNSSHMTSFQFYFTLSSHILLNFEGSLDFSKSAAYRDTQAL